MAHNLWYNHIHHDDIIIPWILLLTTFALWALAKTLSLIFGGFHHHRSRTAAVPVANNGVGAGAGAAVVTPNESGWHKSSHYVSQGLKMLLWLLLIPILFNTVFGFSHTARNLIIAIFAIGILWALLRGLGHVFSFLHRILDFGLFVLVPLSIAAAALGIRHHRLLD